MTDLWHIHDSLIMQISQLIITAVISVLLLICLDYYLTLDILFVISSFLEMPYCEKYHGLLLLSNGVVSLCFVAVFYTCMNTEFD